MPDVVTVLTPIPDWWHDPDTDDTLGLVDAVAAFITASLAGHHAALRGDPDLADSYPSAEGLICVWTADIDHQADCPCRSDAPSPAPERT